MPLAVLAPALPALPVTLTLKLFVTLLEDVAAEMRPVWTTDPGTGGAEITAGGSDAPGEPPITLIESRSDARRS